MTLEGLKPTQLLRLFVSTWDREHKPKRKKRKLRKLDPNDYKRTPKKPKAKS